MSDHPIQAAFVGGPASGLALPPIPGVVVTPVSTLGEAADYEAALIAAFGPHAAGELAGHADLPRLAYDHAVLVIAPQATPGESMDLIRLGAQDVITSGDVQTLERAVHFAVERKRVEAASRHAYATDLTTGLPHRAQLVEHLAHLLALRERRPAPLVLILLQVDGMNEVVERLGPANANVLRRKLAVRLRSLLRAGDIVAATGPEGFGVLIGQIDTPSLGERIASKLVKAVAQPLTIGTQTCNVTARVGLSTFPENGRTAEDLLQRAHAQCTSQATAGVGAQPIRQVVEVAAANEDAHGEETAH